MASKKQPEPNKATTRLIECRTETEYGLYRIVAGEQQGTGKAIAYIGAHEFVADTNGIDPALVALLTFAVVEKRANKTQPVLRRRPEFLAALRTLARIGEAS